MGRAGNACAGVGGRNWASHEEGWDQDLNPGWMTEMSHLQRRLLSTSEQAGRASTGHWSPLLVRWSFCMKVGVWELC